VHVRDVLDAIATREPGLIRKFGGHAMAAGLSLELRHLDRFARAFDEEVAGGSRAAARPMRSRRMANSRPLKLTLATAEALRAAGPWGSGFPEPLFDGTFELRNARLVGGRHLKLQIGAIEGRGGFDAIAFNYLEPGREGELPSGRRQIIYRLGPMSIRGRGACS